MDAISFVLRCKTEVTREKQLGELIHRGVNPSSGASVKLDFVKENEEHIEFMRSIVSTDKSQFRIDGKVVLEGDYDRELEKLHILVKLQNFLVFQGKVQSIASQSPKELTMLIEQVSGSGAYQKEYEKLKKQKDDAEDVAVLKYHRRKTCSRESRQFKLQKDEADRFEKLLAEHLETKRQSALFQLFYIDKDTKRHKVLMEKEKKEFDVETKKQSDAQKGMSELKKEKGKIQKKLLKIESLAAKGRKEIDRTDPETIQTKGRIAQAKGKLEILRTSLSKKEKEQAEQQKEIQSLESELASIREASERYEEQWQVEKEQYEMKLTPSQEAEFQKLKEESSKGTGKLSQELEILRSHQRLAEEKLKRLSINRTEMEERHTRLQETKKGLEARTESVSGHIERLNHEMGNVRVELSGLRKENEQFRTKQTELHEEIRELEEFLQNARVSNRENQREKAQKETLETLKRLFSGVRGRLIDLCKIRQNKYNVAVTVAMGSHMNSIVVDDRQTAMECIQYVKTERLGNFTFLPLDFIKTKQVDQAARQLGGSKKLVLDVIDYDISIEKAVLFAVGNTVVCDSLDEARRFCFGGKEAKKYRCVALDGSLINKSGMMTGGISGIEEKASQWNEKQYNKKKREREDAMIELAEVKRSLRSQAQEEKLSIQLKSMDNTLSHFKSDLKETTTKIKDVQKQIKAVVADLGKIDDEIKQSQGMLNEEAEQDLTQQISKIEKKFFGPFSKKVGLENIQEFQDKRNQLLKQRADKILQHKTLISRMENQLEFERGKRITESLNEVKVNIGRFQEIIKKGEQDLLKRKDTESKLYSKLEEYRKEHAALRESVKGLHTKFLALRTEAERASKNCSAKMKKVNSHESEVYALKNKRMQIFRDCKLKQIDLPFEDDDVQMEDVSTESQSSQSSQMSFSQLLQEEDSPEIDFGSMANKDKRIRTTNEYENRCQEFEEKIRGLALQVEKIAPNMKASGQFKDAEGRLKSAQDDLDTARSGALKSAEGFNHVKEERKKKFMAAYTHIRDNIDHIYKELTKERTKEGNIVLGGNAYLIVENTDEPYLGGIKYNAMPPGKRYLDLDLLSGGEKTLAALGLVFAIHSFQPSPFFVLDEIDAALDSMNVGRVARYLKECSQGGVQCIVISLKPKLFQEADALIGVYRDQKEKCSKTLSYNLAARFDTD